MLRHPVDDATARRIMAVQGYADLGLFEEAEEELGALASDLEIVNALRCELLSRQSRWEEMRALAEDLARRSPEEAQWWISWAYAARRARSISEAREILLEGRRLHPKEALIVYNLACYASVSGEPEDARRLLEEAVALDANFEEMARHDEDLEPLFRDS